jgi:hypothetical protein
MSEPGKYDQYAAYVKERDGKLTILHEQQKFIDGAVLTLGGGGLGLLLTYLHYLTPPIRLLCLGLVAGISLALAIVFALLSVYASQISMHQHVSALDEKCRNNFEGNDRTEKVLRGGNLSTSLTGIFNGLAGLLLILGIGLASTFVALNLRV